MAGYPTVLKNSKTVSGSSETLILDGPQAILEQTTLLEGLALRCGQSGAMHWLKHFLAVPSAVEKIPYLVLVPQEGVSLHEMQLDRLQPEHLRAAVLMFQYRFLGLPVGAFSTDDVSGFRTVVAPVEQRAAVAEIAANAMLERGAQFVLVSYCDADCNAGRDAVEPVPAPRLTAGRKLEWARRRRPVAKTLPLAGSFEATLATLGKATRFNLGYYRRRLLKKMSCEFVPNVCGLLSDSDLDALNAGSLNPVTSENFRLQYRSSCDLPGGFVVGLRDGEGRWLSLIGGWRQKETTVLYWQMNAAGFERDSLGTVMRSYFLEHEVQLGGRQLVVYGGTTHSMGNSFVRETVTELVVRRRSGRATSLRLVSQAWCAIARLTGKPNNFLASAISRDDLPWQPAPHFSDRKTASRTPSKIETA
jgi:hypothetical protein